MPLVRKYQLITTMTASMLDKSISRPCSRCAHIYVWVRRMINLDEGMVGGGEGGQFIEGWINEVAGEGGVGLEIVVVEIHYYKRIMEVMELGENLLLLKFSVELRLRHIGRHHRRVAHAYGGILGLWIPNVSIPYFTFLYVEKAFMNSSHKVLKSVMDLDERPTYHFITFHSSVKANISHIKGSLWWLYRAMAFLCYMIWLDESESEGIICESSHVGYRRKGLSGRTLVWLFGPCDCVVGRASAGDTSVGESRMRLGGYVSGSPCHLAPTMHVELVVECDFPRQAPRVHFRIVRTPRRLVGRSVSRRCPLMGQHVGIANQAILTPPTWVKRCCPDETRHSVEWEQLALTILGDDSLHPEWANSAEGVSI
ncbi:hypothetical protein D8674_019170 [Pyrus ussuriensis x Pyrus communis]|uniref:Uncharacterized protein n=1 Tax=Pyrus ussuriensis x Pyrus communis TaxID=2448454 RepID=A0A5N5G7A0_9ROSA|nr:hypothetical protein D8674_019170 [Pyrus ussuriensis x Pyrus communis]